MLFRHAALRAAPRRAALSTSASVRSAGSDLLGPAIQEERARVEAHAAHSGELWRKITIYGAIPLVLVLGLHMRNVEQQHAEHHEHLKEENGGELPERKVFSYLNMRRKDFPWGVQSLFYNPHVNIDAAGDE